MLEKVVFFFYIFLLTAIQRPWVLWKAPYNSNVSLSSYLWLSLSTLLFGQTLNKQISPSWCQIFLNVLDWADQQSRRTCQTVLWNRLDSEACFECQLPPSKNSVTASTHSVAAAAAIVSRPFRCRWEGEKKRRSWAASHINDISLSSFAIKDTFSWRSGSAPPSPSRHNCRELWQW